ncbi:MAG TPA: DHA2 family efflux MFS transporter permease subunit [Actinomycetes bacterium]|nr:DHA2 family efflux MFS transporter permease subunit [Actinomycetes bacterium]
MLLATILGSGIAFLDSTVVNVALPTIGRELDAGISSLQWVVNAYTLTLSGFLLLGGSLGDHYGRRRVFVIGVAWFAVASLLCGLAPTDEALVAARTLQGIGGALLTPGSLAIIEASFRREDRGPAIGAWSGLGGVTAALGPFLGGWLVQTGSWRLIFLINLPLAVVVVWVSVRHVPESRDPGATGRLDWVGAALAAVGLAGVVYALTDGPGLGWTSSRILAAGLVGVAALAAFAVWERRTRAPMLPLDIFASRQFTAANIVTFVVYGALGGSLFLMPIQLQQVVGYSPLASGVALIPITVLMLLLSARAGRLSARIGPRLPMTLGPLLVAAGFALLARIGPGARYLVDILPASLVYGFGLTLTVAPLTATVLAAAPAEHAGVASAVNNDVARTAGLLAVAVLPVAAGISGADALQPDRFAAGFRTAMIIAAALCAAGGLLSWLTIRNPEPEAALEGEEEGERVSVPAAPPPVGDGHYLNCPLNAPPPVRPPPSRTPGRP